MFTWSPKAVLAAIDAGIVEIVAAYNNSYLYFVRKHVHIAPAYDLAMESTVDWLNRIETERLLLAGAAAIDRLPVYEDAADHFAAMCEAADDAMNPGNWN